MLFFLDVRRGALFWFLKKRVYASTRLWTDDCITILSTSFRQTSSFFMASFVRSPFFNMWGCEIWIIGGRWVLEGLCFLYTVNIQWKSEMQPMLVNKAKSEYLYQSTDWINHIKKSDRHLRFLLNLLFYLHPNLKSR